MLNYPVRIYSVSVQISGCQRAAPYRARRISSGSVISLWCYLSETTHAGPILDTYFLVVFNLFLDQVCEKAVELGGSNRWAVLARVGAACLWTAENACREMSNVYGGVVLFEGCNWSLLLR